MVGSGSHRCRQCGTRRTLSKHPQNYTRLPGCRSCGAQDYRVDNYRQSGREAQREIIGEASFNDPIGFVKNPWAAIANYLQPQIEDEIAREVQELLNEDKQ